MEIVFILSKSLFSFVSHVWPPHTSTHEQMETHGCVLSTVATDALVLKHQDISIPSADYTCIQLDQFIQKYFSYEEQCYKIKLHFRNKYTVV